MDPDVCEQRACKRGAHAQLRKQHILYDSPVQKKALERALNATPEMARGIVERLKQHVEELKNEAWSWEAAYRHLDREGQILRKALHERIDELEHPTV